MAQSCPGYEDRISKLPDALIHQILSSVEIKYVVRTCVLSRRWRYIWTSLPVLRFERLLYNRLLSESEDEEEEDYGVSDQKFVNLVNKVLSLRDNSDIHTFYLDGYANGKIKVDDLCKWIAAAVSCNVQELDINDMCIDGGFEIPACLCVCKSLSRLRLDLNGFGSKVILPSSVSLPRLKSLSLHFIEEVSFNDEKLANKFLSSIPTLESLEMDFRDDGACMNLNVSDLPNLESLLMRNCGFAGMNLNISFPKLKYFELENSKLKGEILENTDDVKLYAPSLVSFILKGYMPTSFTLESLSSLVRADMGIRIRPEDKVAEKKDCYTQLTMKFLRGLHNAKVLKLNDSFLQALGGSPDILLLYSQPLKFCNLQLLELSVGLSRDSMCSILYLLKISPNLESLYLKFEGAVDTPVCPFCDKVEQNSGNIGGLALPFMMDHLKLIKVKNLEGHVNELKLLAILLKHAMVLEKVVLCSSFSGNKQLKQMQKFCEMLQTFPRASTNVMISYSVTDTK